MTASSYKDSWHHPSRGRLQNFLSAWCTKTSSKSDEWLQVDLGNLYQVCGVATEGGRVNSKLALSYNSSSKRCNLFLKEKLLIICRPDLSSLMFEFRRSGVHYNANTLGPIYARYVRFYPTKQHIWNCLRVEVYGTKLNACFDKAVGVANPSIITQKQMTASSYHSSSYQPAYGRLNDIRGDGWCTKTPSKNNEWLQVDLGQLFEVCSVATQGDSQTDPRDGGWVTAFKLYYSQDGKHWIKYNNNGKEMEFRRYGESTLVDNHMLTPIYARYIRFNPTKRHRWNCLRAEVYGKGIGISTCFSSAVGVASSSTITDKQMTASTYFSSQYKPANGRLNRAIPWCARTPSRNDEWLQVDLGQLFLVCGVGTQEKRVMAFKLSYSQDGKHWTTYKDENGNEMEFHRSGEENNVDKHKLKPVSARYIRFNPTKRNKWNCLRVEVYGAVLADCGVNLNKRIVGGQHASPGEWRWHVQVGSGGCSASLLTPQWAITAAHCVKGYDVADVKLT
ncbi:lactadherin-like [Oculina patagonica]